VAELPRHIQPSARHAASTASLASVAQRRRGGEETGAAGEPAASQPLRASREIRASGRHSRRPRARRRILQRATACSISLQPYTETTTKHPVALGERERLHLALLELLGSEPRSRIACGRCELVGRTPRGWSGAREAPPHHRADTAKQRNPRDVTQDAVSRPFAAAGPALGPHHPELRRCARR
jgi:hypothetical protein